MALKDKLMTLEDFKAVRDVDVASNTAQFTEIKADLDALDSKVDNVKISDSVKEALLACFEHIALWTEGDGQEYIEALHTALGSIYPNLSTGNVIAGYYLDASGDAIASGGNYYNDKYFEIESGKDYYWVQGFNGYVGGASPDFSGRTCAYRICYYDESKGFISRQASDPVAFGTAEPRYYKLVIPTGAKYFRVSWSALPCGAIYRAVPSDIYAVTFVLANLDDSEISASTILPTKFTVTRNGQNITNAIKTGNLTAVVNDALDNVAWVKNVFQINQGGSPEIGTQHPETTTRIQNCHTYIMKSGDVISFNGVKAAVRAERIIDGEVQHTTAWITDNSDFVIGGES